MKLPVEIDLIDRYSEGREGNINTLWHRGQADSLVVGEVVSIPLTSVLFLLISLESRDVIFKPHIAVGLGMCVRV
jgi:hypothetical protein